MFGPARPWLPAAMQASVLRSVITALFPNAFRESKAHRVESCPPQATPFRRSSWPARLGLDRHRGDALAAARLDFADALADVRFPGAHDIRMRIAVARSMHELWHFREEVFSLVARRHDQAEAAARLASLNRHFPQRAKVSRLLPSSRSGA